MKKLKAYLAGVATGIVMGFAMFICAWFFGFIALNALDQEIQNRMIRQAEKDKPFILKTQAVRDKLRTDDCLIQDGRMVCQYTDRRGILQRVEITE